VIRTLSGRKERANEGDAPAVRRPRRAMAVAHQLVLVLPVDVDDVDVTAPLLPRVCGEDEPPAVWGPVRRERIRTAVPDPANPCSVPVHHVKLSALAVRLARERD